MAQANHTPDQETSPPNAHFSVRLNGAIHNFSPATQQSYIYAIAKLSRYFGCSPEGLSLEQVRAYQLHLIEQKRSWSHINQVACALRFFSFVSTARYAQVATNLIASTGSPFDQITVEVIPPD